jgi:hypothetical protein
VVADIDADFEGESSCGSADVEERNLLARTAASAADLVAVAGGPGVKGVFSTVRVVRDLVDLGVEARRILPVVNRAPRKPRARAELVTAITQLAGPDSLAPTVFVPERRRLEEQLVEGERLPPALTSPIAGAVRAVLDRLPPRDELSPDEVAPARIVPGSLGSWSS